MAKPPVRAAFAAVALLLSAVLSPLAAGSASAVTQPGGAATRLPVPSDAVGSGQPQITGMSCGGVGFCVAVGFYFVPNGSSSSPAGLIETWSNGTWTAMRTPVPTGATPLGSLQSVSCSGTTCAAWGSYPVGSIGTGYMAVARSSTGIWKAQTIGPPSGDTFPSPSSGSQQAFMGVGCSGPGACAVVGNAYSSVGLRGWAASLQNGTWTAAHETNTPIDMTGQASWLNGISCGGGVCQAAGGYISDVGPEPLIVTVNADGSTNSPNVHVPIPQGATEISDVSRVSCDSVGACAGIGVYYENSGGDAEALVMPVGGTGFQPQQAPTLTPESTKDFPAARLWSVSCAGGGCAFVGDYYDTSETYHPLLDHFGSGGLVAQTAPNNTIPTGVACGGPTFCTTISTDYGAPLDVLTSAGWVASGLTLPHDQTQYALTGAQEQTTACDSASSCWVLGNYAAVLGNSQVNAAFADRVTPTAAPPTPPSVTTSGMPAFALGTSTHFSWHGSDGTAPISHYVVQVRRAAWNGGFGAWTTPAGWGAVSAAASNITVPLPVGDDTCVRVQAVDSAHLASAWSSPRCTARPIDDRTLTTSAGWSRLTGSGYYLGTYTATKSLGASMTRTGAQFDHLALVATECSTCGKVAVYSGSTLLGTINLYRATTLRQAVIALPMVSLRTATVRLRVTTSGKQVQIDGLGVSRS